MAKTKLAPRPPKAHGSSAPGASHFSGAFDPRNAQWRALLREEILDPAEPLIDAHHHLWNKPGQPYMLDEYLADAVTGHNIRASVFVECGAYYRRHVPELMNRLGEVEFANGIAAMAEGATGNEVLVANAIVGTADVTVGAEVGRLLDAQIAAAGGRFKGIRLITKWDEDEALNNGIDPGPFGNIFSTYGGATRNTTIGPALNSVPLWLGNNQGGVGQIDFNALMKMWGACTITGGKPNLGITNVMGFVAIANALDAQRRDVSNTKHDIAWEGLNFNGVDIYADPLAPSSQSSQFLSLGSTGGQAGNNNLIDGAGANTVTGTFTSPAAPSAASNLPANKTSLSISF